MLMLFGSAMTPNALALINPKFTPVHLVIASDAILPLKVNPDAPQGKLAFTVQTVLKGRIS
jgi:hypothetical protein